MKKTNKIIEDHGDWLLIDISTATHEAARMAVDSEIWSKHSGGRVWADKSPHHKYISAKYRENKIKKVFHCCIIDSLKGMEVDHKIHGNMNFVDNRRSNLRMVTGSQNSMNRSVQSRNKSGVTGVTWYKTSDKWRAEITVNYSTIFLGYFKNLKDATLARKRAQEKYFGEYSYMNQPTRRVK